MVLATVVFYLLYNLASLWSWWNLRGRLRDSGVAMEVAEGPARRGLVWGLLGFPAAAWEAVYQRRLYLGTLRHPPYFRKYTSRL